MRIGDEKQARIERDRGLVPTLGPRRFLKIECRGNGGSRRRRWVWRGKYRLEMVDWGRS